EQARLQREASAADARVQPVPESDERIDLAVQAFAPGPRDLRPVGARRRPRGGQSRERRTHLVEREAHVLRSADESEAPQDTPLVAALTTFGPPREDQTFSLVEPQSRSGEAASGCDFTNC